MRFPIHHTFAPHVDGAFLRRSVALLFQPWRWKNGKAIEQLRSALTNRYDADCALFGSGRESLLALMHAMHIRSGEEVIVQGYTCLVVPNAIAAAGATPIFADIDPDTLSMTAETARAAITPRTRAIICQHTFGIPGPLHELRALCDEKKILLIEDCAHILPDQKGPSEVALIGDAVLVSFGRDKAISGVAGGAMLSRKKELSAALQEQERRAVSLSLISIKKILLYPLLYAISRPIYTIGGKALLFTARRLNLFPMTLTPEERRGNMSPILTRIPNACAVLALSELKRLEAINDHRRILTKFYLQACAEHGWRVLHSINGELPLQKFPMFHKNAAHIIQSLKRYGVYLEDGWTSCFICPTSVDPKDAQYIAGSDPKAEEVGEMIFSLPTHPTMTVAQARILVSALTPFLS